MVLKQSVYFLFDQINNSSPSLLFKELMKNPGVCGDLDNQKQTGRCGFMTCIWVYSKVTSQMSYTEVPKKVFGF